MVSINRKLITHRWGLAWVPSSRSSRRDRIAGRVPASGPVCSSAACEWPCWSPCCTPARRRTCTAPSCPPVTHEREHGKNTRYEISARRASRVTPRRRQRETSRPDNSLCRPKKRERERERNQVNRLQETRNSRDRDAVFTSNSCRARLANACRPSNTWLLSYFLTF